MSYITLLTIIFIVWLIIIISETDNKINNPSNLKKDQTGKQDKENINNWENKTYITKKGDLVKSHGEQVIANYLYARGLNYEYEPSYIRKDGGENKPDFFLSDYNIYIEYFGMIDHSIKYRHNMHIKFNTFEDEGMKVISIYPTHLKNNTLKQGLEYGFKKITGFDLPDKRKDPQIKLIVRVAPDNYPIKNTRNKSINQWIQH